MAKRICALLFMALLVLSIVPAVFAEDETGTVDSAVTVDGVDEAVRPRPAVRKIRRDVRAVSTARVTLAKDVRILREDAFRARQANLLRAAKARCDNADEPERCREALEKRVRAVKALSKEKVAKLKKIQPARRTLLVQHRRAHRNLTFGCLG